MEPTVAGAVAQAAPTGGMQVLLGGAVLLGFVNLIYKIVFNWLQGNRKPANGNGNGYTVDKTQPIHDHIRSSKDVLEKAIEELNEDLGRDIHNLTAQHTRTEGTYQQAAQNVQRLMDGFTRFEGDLSRMIDQQAEIIKQQAEIIKQQGILIERLQASANR